MFQILFVDRIFWHRQKDLLKLKIFVNYNNVSCLILYAKMFWYYQISTYVPVGEMSLYPQIVYY